MFFNFHLQIFEVPEWLCLFLIELFPVCVWFISVCGVLKGKEDDQQRL